ncbi:MAG: helix-turn-helix domain-containing protein [Acidimicrobiia bacterium]
MHRTQRKNSQPDRNGQLTELQRLRLSRGLTVEEVGYLAGVNQSTVSRVERGLARPRPRTLVRLARAYGLAPGEFDRIVTDLVGLLQQSHLGADAPRIQERPSVQHDPPKSQ